MYLKSNNSSGSPISPDGEGRLLMFKFRSSYIHIMSNRGKQPIKIISYSNGEESENMIKRTIALLLTVVLIVGTYPGLIFAASSGGWNYIAPLPTNKTLQSVVYGNGLYVAVGDYETIVTSNDGVVWTKRVSSSYTTYYGVTYNNGTFVVVGTSGNIMTSTDGVNWTSRSSGQTSTIYSVTYGNGKFVAAGANGMILTSTDGSNWDKMNSGSSEWYTGISYVNGKFVATGGGTVSNSTDGVTWTNKLVQNSIYLHSVAYGNGKYIVVGDRGVIYASTDLLNWTAITSGIINNFKKILYQDGKFKVFGNLGMSESTDGTAWTRYDMPLTYLNSAVYGNGQYVAVGNSGTIIASSDGAQWTSLTKGLNQALRGIAYGNGKYVTVGAGGLMYSEDGLNWSIVTFSDYYLNSVTYGNGKFVVAGQKGADGYVFSSSDGVNWISKATATPPLTHVMYGNGKYIAVGRINGDVNISNDGENWTTVASSTSNLSSITYGNDRFVGINSSGVAMTSIDGESWISGTQNIGYLSSITYGNDTFVAVGSNGKIMISADGETWTNAASGVFYALNSVTYAKGMFVAVGGAEVMITSPDGINWKKSAEGASQHLYGVTVNNGIILAVGDYGTVLLAETTTDPQFNSIVASTGSVLPSEKVTLTAIGDRQSAPEMKVGSSRYIPTEWTSLEDGQSGTFSLEGHEYKSTYSSPVVGDYTVTATFVLQTWDGSKWENTATVDTKSTTINVSAPQEAAVPIIDQQPINHLVIEGERVTLQVAASTSDSGTLSYQWYSSETGDAYTAISDATSKSYEAPTTVVGTMYYYVVVTNTNDKATGNKTANITSSAAKVEVKAAPTYTISVIDTQEASSLIENYEDDSQETLVIPIANTGTGDLTELSVAISGNNATDFEVTQPAVDNIKSGDPATSFTVRAINGLMAGTYTATITISAKHMNDVSLKVTQVVNMEYAPANPQNLQALAGDHVVSLNWDDVPEATFYNVYLSTDPKQFITDELATVTESTYNVEGLDNGTTYYFVVKAGKNSLLSAESNVASAIPAVVPAVPKTVTAVAGNGQAVVSFVAPYDNGGSPITGYEVTSIPGNIIVTGSTSPITVSGLTNGMSYTFTVKAINSMGKGQASAESNVVIPMSSSSSGGSVPTNPDNDVAGVDIIVNGKKESMGTATTNNQNGQTVTTVKVDEKKLNDRLASEGQRAVVSILMNGISDSVISELTGQIVKDMEDKEAVFVFQTRRGTYTVPASQININTLFDHAGAALKDIKVKIEIAAPSADTVKVVENAAFKGLFTLVSPPVEFTISAEYAGKRIEVLKFNAYVERMIAIPDGVDVNKITTAVVIDPDGTVRHVPTKIELIDGKYYAKVNSLTNSTYGVIWHPVQFSDVANHWARDAVNDLGSRMVVNGNEEGNFSPDENMTRAEFAAILVRALGLKLEIGASTFSDVKTSDWYNSEVNTAYAYKLIDGFEDGKFRPNEHITREQAMTIIAKAMTMTGLKNKLTSQSVDETLKTFGDKADASNWALSGIADSVQAGIVAGRDGNSLAPKAYISRAEVATMIQKLLQKSGLI